MEFHTYVEYSKPTQEMLRDVQEICEVNSISDSRYRCIIGKLDEMIELLSNQPGRNLTTEFDFLLGNIVNHVSSENVCMDMVGFPRTMEHCAHHRFIFSSTAELHHRSIVGHEVLVADLAHIRLLWLVHIKMYDRTFEEYISQPIV